MIDINDYYCAAGHSHEVLLRKTAEQQGIALEGNLLECRGCSMAKGLRKSIKQSTHTRAGKKLGRVFVDLSGPKVVSLSAGSGTLSLCATTFHGIRGCILCATNQTPRNCSSNSSRILAQTTSLRKWSSSDRTGVVSSAGGVWRPV